MLRDLFHVLALKYGENTVSLSLTHFFPSSPTREMQEECIFFFFFAINANSLCINTVDQKPF